MWKTQKCVEFFWIEFQFEGMVKFQWKKLRWIYEWPDCIIFYGNYEILCHWKFWKFFYHESGLKLFESKCFSRRVFYYHLSWKFLLEILFQLFAMWSNNLFILSTQTTLHMTILTQLLIAIFVNNCVKLWIFAYPIGARTHPRLLAFPKFKQFVPSLFEIGEKKFISVWIMSPFT